jgi:hypothetical protein
MTDDDLEWFDQFPLHRPERCAVGHGLRAGEPTVIVAVVVAGEAHVIAFTPEEADLIAQRLRAAAGAVRALQAQEA